ncbi:MAG: sensor histidine kinase KdpD [Deltaproteobacteria bacterium]|nr:sensor histidine kinase KdpD [Deltaproteobacteria bacterium]
MNDIDPTAAIEGPAHECVVVCVGPSPGSERLVHASRRLAESLGARWHAVHVALNAAAPLSQVDRDRVENHLGLAESLGAEVAYVLGSSVAEAVLEFAREHSATRIVAGKPTHSRWRDRLHGSLIDALVRDSGPMELHVIAPSEEVLPRVIERGAATGFVAYARAVFAILFATGIGLLAHVSLTDQAMLYLAAIIVAALGGRAPGVLAAALSVAAYNFFFVPPLYTLAVADLDHLITFAVMFTVGTATGTLVARMRHAEEASRLRERRTSALLSFTGHAAAARSTADVAAAVVAQIEDALRAPASVLVSRHDGELEAVAGLAPLAEQEMAVALWAHRHRRAAGRGTEMQPDARLLAVPLWDGEQSAGVVAVQLDRARRRIDFDARTLLEAIARQAGVAIARLRLGREAHDAALRAQTEEVRSSLLSTVSHDLRTPLAIISGTASALRDSASNLTADQVESLDTIVDEAERLGSILYNLLAITRVESGAALRRDWVPLEEIIGSALGRCDSLLGSHPVAVAVDPDVGARVEPVLFEQIVINLVENAAKHTPAGTPIEVRVRAEGNEAIIEVSDRGPGLPPGPHDQLFEKFVRGPGVRTAGAGLGLAVCRGIALAHGGRIEAEQRIGGGATFRVGVAAGPAPVAEHLAAS